MSRARPFISMGDRSFADSTACPAHRDNHVPAASAGDRPEGTAASARHGRRHGIGFASCRRTKSDLLLRCQPRHRRGIGDRLSAQDRRCPGRSCQWHARGYCSVRRLTCLGGGRSHIRQAPSARSSTGRSAGQAERCHCDRRRPGPIRCLCHGTSRLVVWGFADGLTLRHAVQVRVATLARVRCGDARVRATTATATPRRQRRRSV